MGDLATIKGGREISANGLALAPGFIDTHTHDDRALLSDPLLECKISQGVTTVITGNCGISLAPLSIDALSAAAARHHRARAGAIFFDLRRISLGARPRSAGAQRRVPGRPHHLARRRDGHLRPSGDGRRDRRDAARAGSVAGTGRDRHVHRALLSAGQGCADRRGDRACQADARLWRHPHHAHARRGLASGPVGQRDHRDRQGRGRAGRHLASQGERHAEPRPGRGYAQADRRGAEVAGAGPRRLSLRRRLDHARCAAHFRLEQDHRHLVEEHAGTCRPAARRHREEARLHDGASGRSSCCRPARSIS